MPYLIVGEKITEDHLKEIAMQEIRDFAYDPQPDLFPDTEREKVRSQLRAKLDAGDLPTIRVLKESELVNLIPIPLNEVSP